MTMSMTELEFDSLLHQVRTFLYDVSLATEAAMAERAADLRNEVARAIRTREVWDTQPTRQ